MPKLNPLLIATVLGAAGVALLVTRRGNEAPTNARKAEADHAHAGHNHGPAQPAAPAPTFANLPAPPRSDPAATAPQRDPTPLGPTHARFRRAMELAKQGSNTEALAEYIACFKEGAADQVFTGVRVSFLIAELVKLGHVHPPAHAALVNLQREAERQLLSDPSDRRAPSDFAALSKALNDDARIAQLYNQLPQDDRRRKALAPHLQETFVAARRYDEALMGRSYDVASAAFERETALATGASPTAAAAFRQNAIARAATDVEMYAGAGRINEARDLIAKVLAVDSSPATQELLRTHLSRAGRPELAAALPSGGK